MIGRFVSLPDAGTAAGQAVLQEQFRTLTKQIPVMYALLLVNSIFLGFATYETAPLALSVGFPSILAAVVVGRVLCGCDAATRTRIRIRSVAIFR